MDQETQISGCVTLDRHPTSLPRLLWKCSVRWAQVEGQLGHFAFLRAPATIQAPACETPTFLHRPLPHQLFPIFPYK